MSSSSQATQPATSSTALALCCTAAITTLVPVALYQLDRIPHLPDPPSAIFNSEEITSSSDAHPFGIPDAPLGLISYAGTLTLIAAALPGDGRRRPIARGLLAAKLAIDGTMALTDAITQITRFRRVCSWCMGTALSTAGMLYFGRHLFTGVFRNGGAEGATTQTAGAPAQTDITREKSGSASGANWNIERIQNSPMSAPSARSSSIRETGTSQPGSSQPGTRQTSTGQAGIRETTTGRTGSRESSTSNRPRIKPFSPSGGYRRAS